MTEHSAHIPVHLTHDPEADAAYLHLVAPTRTPFHAARQLVIEDETGDIVLDFSPEGHLLGIELLAPTHQLHPTLRP
ncbi:DUF2283 domain-containing protein [Kitasatospora sp. NPDC093806]|uniref:DUF2283 domain-containing protein n=1 Tax=Kitasatospora sp. NPDC093806 TaxID=3155075 RepID=UPI003414046A